MKKSIKTVAILAATSAMVSAGLAPAQAETAESTVSGGSLAAATSGATLSGVTLDGVNAKTATGISSEWALTDGRGTGETWTLSVSATDFTSAAGTEETTDRTIPVGNLTITPGAVTAAEGSDSVTGIVATDLTLSAAPAALVTASGPNKGTYNLTPSFSLTVPANAYRSNYSGEVGNSTLNPYVSTVTYTIG